jgi:hypothetical protein
MKYRIATLAMAAVAFLGTGGAMAAGSAQAAPAITSNSYTFIISPGLCIVTHGTGNQLTIDGGPSCATIRLDKTANNVYTFTDASGNCIRANSSDVVLVESGACQSDDAGEHWTLTAGSPGNSLCRFMNDKQLLWLKVTGLNAGNKVWVGTGGDNNWTLA